MIKMVKSNQLAEAFPLVGKCTEAVQIKATILKRKMLTEEMAIQLCIDSNYLSKAEMSERRAIIADGIKIRGLDNLLHCCSSHDGLSPDTFSLILNCFNVASSADWFPEKYADIAL